jgi:uncharacterized repeat protein (TIGR01451 family)
VRRRPAILGIVAIFAAPLLFAQVPPNPVSPQVLGNSTDPPAVIQPPTAVQQSVAPALGVPGPIAPVKLVASPTTPASPAVIVEKRCPESINAGQPLIYEIVVRNVGSVPVCHVRVEDELPADTRFIASEPAAEVNSERMGWGLGQLDVNVERKIRVEVQPSNDGEFRATATVTFSVAAVMRTQVVRPKLAVALTGPDQALAGDTLPLQIQISNPGTGAANSVVLRVKLPAGLTHPSGGHIEADIGTLAPGESKNIPLRVVGSTLGAQIAEVSATGDGGLECTAKSQIMVQQPKLQIRRTGPAKVMFRGEVTEEYELTNPGNAPASNVTMTEVLPAGMEFVGASDGAMFDPVGRAVTWKLGQHDPGSTRTVVLKAKANVVGDLATRAVAVADRGIEAKAEGSVAVEGVAALRLEVADLEDPVEVGGELIYEIRVFNQGSCPCTGIRITCDVPIGLTAVEANGASAGRIQGNKVTFESLAKLATKADAVFRVKVRGDQPGDYRFKVQMNCEQLSLPVNKEESSRVYKN